MSKKLEKSVEKTPAEMLKDQKRSAKLNKKTIKKEKRTNTMKNHKTAITAVLSILLTLGVVYAGYWLFEQGIQHEKNRTESISKQVEAEVSSLVKE